MNGMALTTPIIEAAELTKRYEDGCLALDHVTFAIHSGEIYAMLGGNGAGKTTAINLFLNLIDPTEGEARVCGYVTHRDPLPAKQNIAFVSENVMLYSNFTAIEDLVFFSQLGGKSGLDRGCYVEALLRVGLDEHTHNMKIREFSKGMRQKCGIAIAVLKDAPAILLDEPTSGLDPRAGFEFLGLLDSLRADGKAVLMSTHDIFRAKEVADVVAIMDRGRIIMETPIEELVNQDLEQIYLQHMAGQHAEGRG